MATETLLQAGPELDAEIARRVFGNAVITSPRHSGAHAGDDQIWEALSDIPADPWLLRPYSTTIASAWLVVEKMREMETGMADCPWDAFIEALIDGFPYARRLTPESLVRCVLFGLNPERICRAALAALEAR